MQKNHFRPPSSPEIEKHWIFFAPFYFFCQSESEWWHFARCGRQRPVGWCLMLDPQIQKRRRQHCAQCVLSWRQVTLLHIVMQIKIISWFYVQGFSYNWLWSPIKFPKSILGQTPCIVLLYIIAGGPSGPPSEPYDQATQHWKSAARIFLGEKCCAVITNEISQQSSIST